jgi:hypothetical protein
VVVWWCEAVCGSVGGVRWCVVVCGCVVVWGGVRCVVMRGGVRWCDGVVACVRRISLKESGHQVVSPKVRGKFQDVTSSRETIPGPSIRHVLKCTVCVF